MAYTTINKSTDYFNTKLYTGNGSARSITGVGFQPDWLWIKQRSGSENHQVFDAVRTAGKQLETNTTSAESSTSLQSAFNSDGFSINNAAEVNGNGATYVSWNWKANGQGSSNTAGSINTTYTSANTTAGFSIVKWTSTDTAGSTIGHGLGAVPKMIITKKLTSGTPGDWTVYHNSMGNTKSISLNGTGAEDAATSYWNNTSPTASLFSTGTYFDAGDYIAYCFAEKQGYSKIGTYPGNNSTDGTFIYTGFKPKYILWKMINGSGTGFQLVDATINPHNVSDAFNFPYSTTGEYENSANNMDILSNGFKWRNNDNGRNGDANTYIYYAIGQSIVGTNNVPCTAR